MSSRRQARLNELLGEEMVDIYVGRKRKRYHWHKKLVCHYSTYLNRIFNSGDNDGSDAESVPGEDAQDNRSTLFLPEQKPEVFDLLTTWFYRGTLAPVAINEGNPSSARIYVALYCLAETWSLPPVQDLALHRLRQYYRETKTCAEADLIKEVCDKTSRYSPLRTYFEKQAAWTISSQGVLQFNEGARKDLLTANGDFTVGVVQELLANRSNGHVEIRDPGLESPEPEVLNSTSSRHRASKSTKQESDDENSACQRKGRHTGRAYCGAE